LITITEENKRLFGEQVSDHISKLNELMGFTASAELDEVVVERVNLATRLLEGSTRMLGLTGWADTLSMLHELLIRGVAGGGQWDEKLSQVVSEVLESEEQMLAEILTGEVEDIDCTDLFSGLQKEIEYLLNEDFVEDGKRGTPGIEMKYSSEPPTVDVEEPGRRYGSKTIEIISNSVEEIRDRLDDFMTSGVIDDEAINSIETSFGQAEFAIAMLHNMVKRLKGNGHGFRAKVGSDRVVEVIKDFFSIYNKGEHWNAKLEADCGDFPMDLHYAKAVASASQAIILDVSRMFATRTEPELVIYIGMKNESDRCVVDIRDNGTEFLNDSKFDKPDPASFYYSLREVRAILERFDGLLWVEPSFGQDGRFRFAVPVTDSQLELVVFRANGHRFAIRSSVVDSTVRLERSWMQEANRDRVLDIDGMSVPVFSMAELIDSQMSEDESEDRVVILGLADRRIGILMRGEIEHISVNPIQISSNENGLIVRGILNIDDDEIPVLDTVDLMNRSEYLRRYEMSLEDVEGFVD